MSIITIAGGEVSNHKGTTVTYKLKCEGCGFIDSSETTVTMMRGVTK